MPRFGDINRKFILAAVEQQQMRWKKYTRKLIVIFISLLIIAPCLWFLFPGQGWIATLTVLFAFSYLATTTYRFVKRQ
ncbi:hypothetical protein [Cylindrospermum sp. FACHB-282]|uniref:hypothetical protein n=1 Tax=Cylindrospermum sp. FACHB-282 TaxID=2692794 RepID=UPI0016833D2F|nr:hypothetical protein [Cylindrospermum sp. FACHB-282]MBD2388808.1 hypothetical protein [Cylindrospermum sp. FACHB-282]